MNLYIYTLEHVYTHIHNYALVIGAHIIINYIIIFKDIFNIKNNIYMSYVYTYIRDGKYFASR